MDVSGKTPRPGTPVERQETTTGLAIGLVAMVALAAVVRPLRPAVALALLGWLAAVRLRGRPVPPPLAAVLPVALILAWGALPQPVATPGVDWCEAPLSPPSTWRLAEASVGLLGVVALVMAGTGSLRDLGLRRPSGRVAVLSVLAFIAVGPVGLLGGTLIGGLFFGRFELDLLRPWALVPAFLFAASNALAEELAYRGALRVWLLPALGIVGANLAQALVFGLAHTGDDFDGPMAPVILAMIAGGFIGGVIARRTGSLAFPLAVHAAADLPIYYYWACRVAG
ncbi:MAG TPA: type II CAAX endopeptidase family protein [Candidatus Sulfomarinibacteraceae bacterium]|nr:type II CAAX endopeptidase family protein [Candidatus Sulfomarinibacteraceae bacterium]